MQGTVDQSMALWPNLYTKLTLVEPGRDGRCSFAVAANNPTVASTRRQRPGPTTT